MATTALGRKLVPICLPCRGKDRVAADIGSVEETEEDITWGLDLVADVLVPETCGGAFLHEPFDFFLVAIAMDDVKGRMALDGA